MRGFFKKGVLVIIVILLLGLFLIFIWPSLKTSRKSENLKPEINLSQEIIGSSVEGREIESYTYNIQGKKHLVFVGGIHGGYEWNSVILAYEFMDYLEKNLKIIPEDLKVTVIPNANPDGVYKIISREGRFKIEDVPKNVAQELGRFNARGVDLNRNFDCKWKKEGVWRGNRVSAGTEPFSEPEAAAIRDFALIKKPTAFIFWHSQANAVYASECEKGILPETLQIMNVYARATGYKAVSSFDSYEVTGDAEGWLASIDIPAITVELKTHETIEWPENLAGIKALFAYYQDQ